MKLKKFTKSASATFLATSILVTGCSNETTSINPEKTKLLSSEPHGVYYEILVRSFAGFGWRWNRRS
ncbi:MULTISPECIES: hypothetical protein [unclassified Bacillus (in: firmicutes)]|uniref:hypothetical protein n=1 Tax=unclassified Bacillus (in: firmicutes) TaxID=185979 RepID=UPI001BEA5DCC|nr:MULTISPECIES: hypothetical protein [unclassified Bacillus (in: firmicutes)]